MDYPDFVVCNCTVNAIDLKVYNTKIVPDDTSSSPVSLNLPLNPKQESIASLHILYFFRVPLILS